MKRYNAKKTKYADELFASKFEARCAFELDMRLAAKELVSWEPQVKIPLLVNGYKVADYNIDFRTVRSDGVIEYIEAKGYAGDTAVWRLKHAMLEAMAVSGMLDQGKRVIVLVMWQGNPGKLRKIKKV